MRHWRLVAALLPTLFMLPAVAAPQTGGRPALQVLVKTTKPGGVFGFWGMDLLATQRAAARFTVPAGSDMQLARIGIYLMNNSDTDHPNVRISLQTDALDEGGTETLPSGIELEAWNMPVQTLGWNPLQQVVTSMRGTSMRAGANYWVVADSSALPGNNAVWNFAGSGNGYSTTSLPNGQWQTAGNGAAPTLRVTATPRGPGPVPNVGMSLASSTIRVGERTLMAWGADHARRCFAGGAWSGQWPTEDSVYVSPVGVGVYEFQLVCTNGIGRGGDSVVLTVVPAN